VKRLLAKQKFQNEVINKAALGLVSEYPCSSDSFVKHARQKRTEKLGTWLNKSKLDPTAKQDLPQIPGLGKIKLISR
jgi:hypothetical protein